MRRSGLLAACLFLLCGSCRTMGAPPVEEAETFQAKLRVIALGEPEQRLGLLAVACRDLPSCSGACDEAYAAFASLKEPQRSEKMLATCFEFNKYAATADVTQLSQRASDWVHLELRSYASRAAKVLGERGDKLVERLERALAGEPPFMD